MLQEQHHIPTKPSNACTTANRMQRHQLNCFAAFMYSTLCRIQATPHVAAIAANCILSGACTGKTGLDNLATILAAAQLRAASTVSGSPQYGFSGDASSTINGKYRGLLVWSAF